ncbi:hypothetical protein C2845_PM12G13030 [Panicum miliaceum]|uniref:Uncharacterized protein n=1 Tax=Panicum miliaceum TaxID=4540 RepID=A0A3L6QDT8_PANMI|nr:hypothetical protein C2845_PM12G13030 [Panicum miliaceum]
MRAAASGGADLGAADASAAAAATAAHAARHEARAAAPLVAVRRERGQGGKPAPPPERLCRTGRRPREQDRRPPWPGQLRWLGRRPRGQGPAGLGGGSRMASRGGCAGLGAGPAGEGVKRATVAAKMQAVSPAPSRECAVCLSELPSLQRSAPRPGPQLPPERGPEPPRAGSASRGPLASSSPGAAGASAVVRAGGVEQRAQPQPTPACRRQFGSNNRAPSAARPISAAVAGRLKLFACLRAPPAAYCPPPACVSLMAQMLLRHYVRGKGF